MEQYLELTCGNQAPSVVKPEIGGNVNFEIKREVMDHEVKRLTSSICFVYSLSLLLELQRDGWTDYLHKQSTPRTFSKRISLKGIVYHLKRQSSLRKSTISSKKVMRHCTKHGKGAKPVKELNLTKNVYLMKRSRALRKSKHIIVAGAENRPPMLDKSTYDSWESHILLFIKGKKHGRVMLDSTHNGPLVYVTVARNGQTRPKKYFELTEAQLQDDCDVQETNIIFHSLSPDVYALVNHQEADKDI
nr:hypothetical protein [Tanacetum cinerariifolium]